MPVSAGVKLTVILLRGAWQSRDRTSAHPADTCLVRRMPARATGQRAWQIQVRSIEAEKWVMDEGGVVLVSRASHNGEEQAVAHERLERLRRVKAKYEDELMRKAHVVGVGIGTYARHDEEIGEPTIVVSVTHKAPPSALPSKDVIPNELEGIRVEVRAVGDLRALAPEAE